jgi:hypothetical protein
MVGSMMTRRNFAPIFANDTAPAVPARALVSSGSLVFPG